MNKVVDICDKCGKVIEFPNELKNISVSYRREDTRDWSLQLCAACKQEFDNLKDTFTEAKRALAEIASADLAKHILGREENGGQE